MYHSRVVDDELKHLLTAMGAVVLEGPKACGKTETARQVAASEVRLDVDQNARKPSPSIHRSFWKGQHHA